jgi:protein-disulfide isomerase
MASRAEQKAAARAARAAKQQELSAAAARRMRLMWLGGIVAAAVIALVVVIIASSGGGGGVKVTKSAKQAAVASVNATLAGIPQSGNVLGNPKAKVTVTEWGDLVCPTCKAFALTSEPQLITADVKTGKAKLVYRAFDTASSYFNQGEYVNTQVAAKAAGLQGKEWQYVLLDYQLQPNSINGVDAEDVAYVTPAYIQNLAATVPGLNLAKWQNNTTNQTLINEVNADETAGRAAGVTGTPGVVVSGPKGSVSAPATPAVPPLDELQAMIAQVS